MRQFFAYNLPLSLTPIFAILILDTVEAVVIASAVVSFAGGVAYAMRHNKKFNVWFSYGLNTGLLGGGVAAMAANYIESHPSAGWVVFGGCAIGSLSGYVAVNILTGLLLKWVKKHNDGDDESGKS